jgi:protein involved in polysaccharide export with SLBB domain
VRSTDTRASSQLTRCLAFVLLIGCAGSSVRSDVPTVAASQAATLGAGDVFEVEVYDEKDLSGKYQVADDGSINFPLVGWIQVAGKGSTEVARALEQTLKDKQILRNPSVSIMVVEHASQHISVVGAVQKPGSFPVIPGLSVVQAISLAGGFTPLASGNGTIVTRQVGTKLERYRVAVKSVTEGREKDFVLQAGDIVFVPERIF